MKKFLKLFLVAVASFGIFTACDKTQEPEKTPTQQTQATVKNIAVDAASVPAEIVKGQAETEIAKIKLVVTMSDDTTQSVNVTKDMISAKDLEKLADIGTYKVTITYEGKTVEVTLVVVEEDSSIALTDITLTVEKEEVTVNYGASYSVSDGVKAIGNDGVNYNLKLTYVITNAAGQTVEKVDTQVENEVYTIVINIDYAGIKKSVTKKVTIGEKPDTSGNLIPNGQFVLADGVYNGWDLYTGDGGTVTLESETINGTSYAKFVEETCASTAYGNRLHNNSDNYFSLYNGQAYQVSFYAKASEAKTIQCQVGQLISGAPYFYSFGGQTFKFNLTTEMALYSFTFVASNAGGGELSASSVTFEMGMVDGDSTVATIWLGEVSVTEFSGEIADQIAPVITASNKTVYIGESDVVDLSKYVQVNDAVDGDLTPTYVIKNEAGETVTSIDGTVAGVYTVDISAEDAAGNTSNATITIRVKAKNTASEIKYEMVDGAVPNAGEDNVTPDTLSYWNDQNWCGSSVTMVKNEVANGVATFEYTGTGTCAFGFQLFLKNTSLDEGSTYTLQLKVNVATAVTATINGVPTELVAGDNNVSVEYTEGNGVSSVDAQFPITDGCSNTIKISEVKWLSSSSKIKHDIVDGAVPNAGEDNATPDTLSYWNDQNWCGSFVTMVKNEAANGVATFEYTGTGACAFGFQLFLKNTSLDEGVKYNLSLKINVATAVTATINGVPTELVAGDNNVSVEYIEGNGISSVDAQFPITDGCSNTVKVSDLTWQIVEESNEEPKEDLVTELADVFEMDNAQLAFVEEANMTADQIGYWADNEWCGSKVTINAANVTDNAILVDYSATGTCGWGLQLFYKNSALTVNTRYVLTLKITATNAATITINNKSVTLVAGVNEVSIDYIEGLETPNAVTISSIDIQIPVDNNSNVLKLENIKWSTVVEN